MEGACEGITSGREFLGSENLNLLLHTLVHRVVILFPGPPHSISE
jgi:hypothetical protein